MRNDILVAEISGRRPLKRPTENFNISYDKVIISNDSNGYTTDWNIINVPDDYREWYCGKAKMSDNAWYAPMNRSYAVKYAKEHGYRYLVQLDDNIDKLEIAYMKKYDNGITKRFRIISHNDLMDDFIEMLAVILDNTNAGMAGFNMCGITVPGIQFLAERYVYSFFALKLDAVPELFQGDFEDDIDFRLKLYEMGVPSVQCCPFMYGKTGQNKDNDTSGNRKAYIDAGLKRGEHMLELHGDVYSCGFRSRVNNTTADNVAGEAFFKHRLKNVKAGVLISSYDAIEKEFEDILKRNQNKISLKDCIIKKKKVALNGKDRKTADQD